MPRSSKAARAPTQETRPDLFADTLAGISTALAEADTWVTAIQACLGPFLLPPPPHLASGGQHLSQEQMAQVVQLDLQLRLIATLLACSREQIAPYIQQQADPFYGPEEEDGLTDRELGLRASSRPHAKSAKTTKTKTKMKTNSKQ